MKKILENWKKLPVLDRILNGVITVCSLAVVVLAILSIWEVGSISLLFCMPLMVVTMLCQGVVHLRMHSRTTAIISFCSGGVITLCFVISLFV